MRRRYRAIFCLLWLLPLGLSAQIIIGGNVYGGGNAGAMSGNTSVTIHAGDLNNVFGGSRVANVGGSTFVNIDGEHASSYIVINKVFGGNDIAGTIGKGDATTKKIKKDILERETVNGINDTWDAVVKLSTKMLTADVHYTQAECNEYNTANGLSEGDEDFRTTSDIKTHGTPDPTQKTYIGQLFAGGNGDYVYTTTATGEHVAKQGDTEVATSDKELVRPNLAKTYLEVLGGSIVYAYGGGNNATVTDSTVICYDNPSTVVNSIIDTSNPNANTDSSQGTVGELLTNRRFSEDMGINLGYSKPSSDEFQVGRFFGGNNKADMACIPQWSLLSGKIRNLYSGGNEGMMTSPTGILLTIPKKSTLIVDNVFGGCRKADVKPMAGGVVVDHVYNPEGYKFPNDLAARLLVRGGDVNNVYGGNDIAGKVYFGNAVGVYTSVRGNVYGGGNGSYPYTDNPLLKDDPIYSDFYYEPGSSSVDALDAFRPNAEQVSLRLAGTDANHPTIIGGSVYVGGNSATLKKKAGQKNYLAELKIGSHVYADNVFLGNNGADMVDASKTEKDGKIIDGGVLRVMGATVTKAAGASQATVTLSDTPEADANKRFNSIDLTDAATFSKYMDGCAMGLMPNVVFDKTPNDPADYDEYSSYFGSFFCGGNVGSMTEAGTDTLDFNYKVIIYDKLVGGCNNAIVPATKFNAFYEGGVIGSETERASGLFTDEHGNVKNRLILNLANLKIQPMRWAVTRDGDYEPILTDGKPTYLLTDQVGDDPTTRHRYLEWNTVDSRVYDIHTKTYKEMAPADPDEDMGEDGKTSTPDDEARRFYGGNIYGGCCQSGIVNGNVVINLDAHIVERATIFDEVKSDELGEEESLYGASQTDQTHFKITNRNTGVILAQQGMDVFGSALNVFGGGKGKDTEIWGSTVINLNRGYTFQIFGGSEEGVIGKPTGTSDEADYTYDTGTGNYSFNGKLYKFDPKFSCYVNLCGAKEGVSKKENSSEEMAACEFVYSGGFFGPICGNTVLNLGNGRIFNSFASCNGDILGTAETFIGRQVKDEYRVDRPANVIGNDVFKPGFPWVRDIVYGANDLGGRILGESNYESHVRGMRSYDTSDFDVRGKVHALDGDDDGTPDVFQASAYVEYLQGRADGIFGGCYGTYDYSDPKFDRYTYTATKDENGNIVSYSEGANADNLGEPRTTTGGSPLFFKPRLNNAFVNFRPTNYNTKNVVKQVFGAGQGEPGEADRDKMQNRSYVLVDIPDSIGNYDNLEVFGAGAWCGVGMKDKIDPATATEAQKDSHSAIVDLIRGKLHAAYGGSYEEGFTRRTVMNVPAGSTINVYNIFGGAYGTEILPPCDVYESYVNYRSEAARVGHAIYGGNNNERRTLYTKVDISVPVWSDKEKGYLATVFGAGHGKDTWSEYTEVNLLRGAKVYEAYGGSEMGHVLNAESVQAYMHLYKDKPSAEISARDPKWSNAKRWDGGVGTGTVKSTYAAQWAKDWHYAWAIDNYYAPNDKYDNYTTNTLTNLNNPALVRTATELDAATAAKLDGDKHNTNVIINEGATVVNYAYGGGLGDVNNHLSGDIYGTTYIALLGGEVIKDIYAAGTAGSITDLFAAKNFTASANAYIKGGTVRNVFGGGWRGGVGHHTGTISDVSNNGTDIPGETHIVIGDLEGTSYNNGLPTVKRNVYGGGEGGAIYGTARVYMNNGYVGYRFEGASPTSANPADYKEELDDVAAGDSLLYRSGNIFGGGYVANSYVDNSDIKMYGGTVRGSLYGGGELGPIGRGTVKSDAPAPTGTVENGSAKIYKAGTTRIELYDGHVLRNVFGGGRGFDNWGGEGYMTDAEKLTMDRSSKGYIFGQTQVYVHGGEIGTDEGMAENFGNVFGGCDVGYLYSAYNVSASETACGKKSGTRFDGDKEGYYYKYENGAFVSGMVPTEDIKVVVGPNCRVTAADGLELTGIFYPKETIIPQLDLDYIKANPTQVKSGTYNSDGIVTADLTFDRTYSKGDFVSTYALHTLKDKVSDATKWSKIDDRGIIIHNAVFAGGNVSAGSTEVFANTTTVIGNATASIHDVYHRDLITVGTGHTGGLYGEGNLTLVDGYRGLNITNYGTDYYNISMEISLETYKSLPKREQAYYELKYTCIQECTDINGKTYHPATGSLQASSITADELQVRFEGTSMLDANGKPDPAYWEENGVCSRYAGRIMNTIQRADFCGVFGSRMVMQGAQDRVPEIVDKANYTINRVREVSLNKRKSVISDDLSGDRAAKHKEHGNYFGIYSNVNFLGALTSDVFFSDVRTTNNTEDGLKADGKTFYAWKEANSTNRKRNRATCHNEVALASGVYLEITTDNPAFTNKSVETKDWGYITGVIVLDLINVQQGVGGGFVYAKNVHGEPEYARQPHATLTALNANAVTRKDFTYDAGNLHSWETSGNFVHDTQTIIDDCYPISNKYSGKDAVPAHYWYIKGTVYIYDQYISAYTGSPNAYSEVVNIPLTISAASHGKMTLMDIKPNRYAYYSDYKNGSGTKLGPDDVLELNGKTYKLNDPITYWDYNVLSAAGQRLFVEKTYVTIAECQTGGKTYPKGYVMLQSEYEALRAAAPKKTIDGEDDVKYVRSHDKDVAFDYVFRESNNIGHDKGYILTYEVNNPKVWDTWYTPTEGVSYDDKIDTDAYKKLTHSDQDNYNNGPTYKPTANGVYGQHDYQVGDIISQTVQTGYASLKTHHSTDITATGKTQATFEKAYVVTKTIEVTDNNGNPAHLYPGATVVASDYTDTWASMSSSVTDAYVCTSTLEFEDKSMLLINTILSDSDIKALKDKYPSRATDIDNVVQLAYSCTTAGSYGGDYYETTKNYRGLAAWSSMSPADREKFNFNYDALNLFIDPTYGRTEGQKYQYDGEGFTTATAAAANKAGYSLTKPVDYTATYEPDGTEALTYKDKNGTTQTVAVGEELSREDFEALPNEKRHYSPVKVPDDENYKVYVVNKSFIHGDTPYAAGQTLTNDEFKSMNESDLANITTLEFTAADADKTFFFCRESYDVNENGEGITVKNLIDGTGFNKDGSTVTLTADTEYKTGNTVPVGILIDNTNYGNLTNRQADFTIHGIAPIETSTLYVSRESDIFDLSTEKIITVIYEYNYEEADESGMHISPVSERHVVNIHITFESGVPTVEDISAPKIVLPGTLVNLRVPNVTPGAYEVTGGGWMLFEKVADTESHSNGIEYTPTKDPLYWYQDGYYVAYYAQTYLGRTFSNAVQVSVANYHDLADVMADHNKTHHMYIDDKNVKRDPKIYITTSDGLDLFKDLYDLSVLDGSAVEKDDNGLITYYKNTTTDHPFKGHALLNSQVHADRNLEFFLRTDLDHGPFMKPNPAYDPDNPDETDPETIEDPNTWTPIGTDAASCFEGTLHGEGHTLTGLSNSLFNHLCGDVYNLGVRGSFTGGGIAETGGGYVENCWVQTSKTPTSGAGHYAVFANPSRESGTLVQVVNCYYPESNTYTEPTGSAADHGVPIKKPEQTFYNGEVAYDLNGFYLYKRYCDNTSSALGGSPAEYNYWKPGESTPQTGHYGSDATLCSAGYVEGRYTDGDFIYSDGTIPEDENERLYVDGEGNRYYYPLWPDDYLFFGQALNYGHMDGNNGRDLRTSQEWPSAVVKSETHIQTDKTGNRVYRAPAYFRSSKMGVAHFNQYAVFAATENLTNEQILDNVTPREVYRNMTAIDFTGSNGDLAGGYAKGLKSVDSGAAAETQQFYPPLLDDDGLADMYNADLTRNLLAYTGTFSTAAIRTDETVAKYLHDEAYEETETAPVRDPYYNTFRYRTVAERDVESDKIRGHRVQKQDDDTFLALNDHVLVDRQDFNAPMAYTFDSDYRMWYQRIPDNYVGKKKADGTGFINTDAGWEGISLPFKAEIVTTNDKGEITHFYNNAGKDDLGHEYWLREFTGGSMSVSEPYVYVATLNYPNASSPDGAKDYTNTFLWDYYYNYNNYISNEDTGEDQNKDEYQQNDANRDYYKHAHSYDKYPRLAAATPYIIGFPGQRYYEFDLSGSFSPTNTFNWPTVRDLKRQAITFASATGASIAVSDTETGVTKSDNYTFRTSYLNQTFDPGTANTYTLDAAGDSYDLIPVSGDAVTVSAFRPYFTRTSGGSVKGMTRSIVFSNNDSAFPGDEYYDEPQPLSGYLDIRAVGRRVLVTSYLEADTNVTIVTAAGALIDRYTITPGQTVETRINTPGVYLVNHKKLSIK